MSHSLVGQKLGEYQVERLIGIGAMGEVYEVSRDNQRFAIKIIHEELAQQGALRERFLREVRMMQVLQHPHIVPIVDFGWNGKRLFLVMPYIDGITLTDMMKAQRFSPLQVWKILVPLTQALEHAHAQGVVHRDLKPGNILITYSDAHLYLLDFGLGKRPDQDIRLTEAGISVGTPSYMSPEAAAGEEVDSRSDIYSLGIMLYELLLGKLPFEGLLSSMIMYAHLYEPVPLPSGEDRRFPFALEAVILRCLVKDRWDRYATMGELIADYEAALQSLTETEASSFYGNDF
ncbi:MAG: serine/threonine-protein kinase [Chloroflexota bacterium]